MAKPRCSNPDHPPTPAAWYLPGPPPVFACEACAGPDTTGLERVLDTRDPLTQQCDRAVARAARMRYRREAKVLVCLLSSPAPRMGVVRATGLDWRTAAKALDELTERGRIYMGGDCYYRIADPAAFTPDVVADLRAAAG